MYDIAREQRRNRVLIVGNICLVVGALILLSLNHRSLVNWMLLVSSLINLTTTLTGRRALSRLSDARRDQE